MLPGRGQPSLFLPLPRALKGDGGIAKRGPGVWEPRCRSAGCRTRRQLERRLEVAGGQVSPPQGVARLGAGTGPAGWHKQFPGAVASGAGTLPPWGSMCRGFMGSLVCGFGVGRAVGREAGPPLGPLGRLLCLLYLAPLRQGESSAESRAHVGTCFGDGGWPDSEQPGPGPLPAWPHPTAPPASALAPD